MTLPSAKELLAAMAAKRARELAEKEAAARAEADERLALHTAFMEREVAPDAMERIAVLVRRAADRGQHRVEVMRFPSAWMLDKGRSVTSGYGDWTRQLDGFAARACDFFREKLEPLGYGVSAAIADYPDGLPGDVVIHLTWEPSGEEGGA